MMNRFVLIIGVWIFVAWPSLSSAITYDLSPGQNMVGTMQYIEAESDDTLLSIAYEFDLGYEELAAANPEIDIWKPPQGARIILPLRFILPSEREGILINTANYRLYYFPAKYKGKRVITYPISVGRGEWPTPKKSTIVIDKLENPAWYPPSSVRAEHEEWGDPLPNVVPPGEDNPLGQHALQLDLPGYLIHGTNKPYGIGMDVTHGCVRLRPSDISHLFTQVPRKTKVSIIDEPYVIAVESGTIYLEAHTGNKTKEGLSRDLTNTIKRTLKNGVDTTLAINWRRLAEVAEKGSGFPQAINWGASNVKLVKAQRRKVDAFPKRPEREQSAPHLF